MDLGQLFHEAKVLILHEVFSFSYQQFFENMLLIRLDESLSKSSVGVKPVLQLVSYGRCGTLWDQIVDLAVRVREGDLSVSHLHQGQEDQLFVALTMHFVSTLSRVRKHKLELLNCIFVSLETSIEKTLVVEVAQDVHWLSSLQERYNRIVDHLKGVLITLGFETQLGELLVE